MSLYGIFNKIFPLNLSQLSYEDWTKMDLLGTKKKKKYKDLSLANSAQKSKVKSKAEPNIP